MKPPKPQWQAAAPALAEARRVLPEILAHYFAHGDEVAGPETSVEALHEFRLAAKHVRYTLELFEPLLGETIRAQTEGIRKVQQVLGQFNDCEASLELLDSLEAPCEPAWRAFIEDRAVQRRAAFEALWNAEFAPVEVRQAWIAAVGAV